MFPPPHAPGTSRSLSAVPGATAETTVISAGVNASKSACIIEAVLNT